MGSRWGYINSGDQVSLFWGEVDEELWFEPLRRGIVVQAGTGHRQPLGLEPVVASCWIYIKL